MTPTPAEQLGGDDVPIEVVTPLGIRCRLVPIDSPGADRDAWQPIEGHDGGTREVLGMNEQGDIHRTWYFAPSSQTRNWLIVGKHGRNRPWHPIKFMPLPVGTINRDRGQS